MLPALYVAAKILSIAALDDGLQPPSLDVTEAAARLGVARTTLSRVLNGRFGFSPELVLRLETANVSTARFWMTLQTDYELSQAAKRARPRVKALQSAV